MTHVPSHGGGALDMAGNVFEWVNDWYGDSYYSTFPVDGWPSNPLGPDTGTSKVVRGGAWNYYDYESRVAYRLYNLPGSSYSNYLIGFRCAVNP